MNNVFIDVDYAQINKCGEKICGDVFILSRNPDNNQIVATLSDGLGSGVKANVLASLTAHMAHKLSFSPIDLDRSARIIMDTLPVCKERKISYSTFTIATIRYDDKNSDIDVNLIEYDNPDALRFSSSNQVVWKRSETEIQRDGAFKKEVVLSSEFKLSIGERLVMFSDGIVQSGMGKSFPLGLGISGITSFIQNAIKENSNISSRELSHRIVQRANELDSSKPKDDITAVVVYVRRPRRTLVVTGPPFREEDDYKLIEKIDSFSGRKVIAGGTTAQIISRLSGKQLSLDLSCWSKRVPPSSKMEGMDLVTEGMLTLSEATRILEKKIVDTSELPNDPAKKLVEILLDSDQVHFIVGTKVNEAHQDPNLPVEIGIRRTIVGRLRKALEEIYLKETTQEYL